MLQDLTHKKFNKLIVLRFIGIDKFHKRLWECKCECGRKTRVITSSLIGGQTKSCGCLVREKFLNMITKHGMGNNHNRFYRCWADMIKRTTNPNRIDWKYYGGRNITVSTKWLQFNNFRLDMYNSYLKHSKKYTEKDTTLDRINVNKGYSKSNCRWATRKEQTQNRRKL